MKKSNPFGCLVRKCNEMASCALTIGSPPVWPKSYDRNSVPRNVASLGALSFCCCSCGEEEEKRIMVNGIKLRYEKVLYAKKRNRLVFIDFSLCQLQCTEHWEKMESRVSLAIGRKIEFIIIFAAAANHNHSIASFIVSL